MRQTSFVQCHVTLIAEMYYSYTEADSAIDIIDNIDIDSIDYAGNYLRGLSRNFCFAAMGEHEFFPQSCVRSMIQLRV